MDFEWAFREGFKNVNGISPGLNPHSYPMNGKNSWHFSVLDHLEELFVFQSVRWTFPYSKVIIAHMRLKVNEKWKVIFCVFLTAMITDISYFKLSFNLTLSELNTEHEHWTIFLSIWMKKSVIISFLHPFLY